MSDYADPHVTLCDFDGAQPSTERLLEVSQLLGISVRGLRIDRTRRGWHWAVTWARKMTPAQQVALQAILGSDYRREALNLMRVLAPGQGPAEAIRWNVLYANKVEK